MPVPVVVVSSEAGPRTANALLQLASQGMPSRTAALLPGRDARLANEPALRVIRTRPQDVRLGEGCACCTVRGDLLKRIRGLARDGQTDRILVHATPGDDLGVIAKTFTVADESGSALESDAWLDGLVVVAGADELVRPRSPRALVERIELATVVSLDGDGASAADRDRATRMVRALNPTARIIWADTGTTAVGTDAGDAPFDLGAALERAKLGDILDGNGRSQDDEINRFVFSARRPFHTERLHAWLKAPPPGLLRARGGFWVATRPHVAVALDVAMADVQTDVEGHWWAAVPEDQRPTGPQWKAYQAQVWHEVFGDRRQEIAFVGTELDEATTLSSLQACLLTERELAAPTDWATAPHPFHWPTQEAQ